MIKRPDPASQVLEATEDRLESWLSDGPEEDFQELELKGIKSTDGKQLDTIEHIEQLGSSGAAREDEDLEGTELEGVHAVVDSTELEGYEAADIEEKEQLEFERVVSIVESVLFATDRPVSIGTLKQAFKGTTVRSAEIRKALEQLQIDYAGGRRGVSLEEIAGGFQMRTKADNMAYLRQMAKTRPFKLSGPTLEVLSIVAYKQPITKFGIDEIRGVDSGHLLRALMERGLIVFAGKSDLPGKPMLYATTRKFLEIFGLRNLQELPSISEIDDLIPEGIGDVEESETLSSVAENLAVSSVDKTYSQGEDELLKITDELENITTTSEFFEQEKIRALKEKEAHRARDIRDAITLGEPVEEKDKRWLERYEQGLREEAEALELAKSLEVQEVVPLEDSEPLTEDMIERPITIGEDMAAESETGLRAEGSNSGGGAAESETKPAKQIGRVDFKQLERDLEIFNEQKQKDL